MPKLAIIATIEIAAGRLAAYLPIIRAHRDRCLRDEPGTLQFDILCPHDDDTKVVLYELYRDDAAFDAHWAGASRAQHREEAIGILLNISGVRHSVAE